MESEVSEFTAALLGCSCVNVTACQVSAGQSGKNDRKETSFEMKLSMFFFFYIPQYFCSCGRKI